MTFEEVTNKVFNIGDRVIGTGMQDGEDLTGEIGTIVAEAPGYNGYTVDFDEGRSCFHTGVDGKARKGHGWNCNRIILEPYEDPATFEVPELTGLLI